MRAYRDSAADLDPPTYKDREESNDEDGGMRHRDQRR
jgi:hypothetical protein